MSVTPQHSTATSLQRNTPKSVVIRLKRRANPDAPQYWEKFEIAYRPNLNVISCLMEIRKHPFQHAPDWQDDARRTARRHHWSRRRAELQQRKQLRARLPDVYSNNESDLRGKP